MLLGRERVDRLYLREAGDQPTKQMLVRGGVIRIKNSSRLTRSDQMNLVGCGEERREG